MPHSKTIAVCLHMFLCDICDYMSDKSDILLDQFVNLPQKTCDSITKGIVPFYSFIVTVY